MTNAVRILLPIVALAVAIVGCNKQAAKPPNGAPQAAKPPNGAPKAPTAIAVTVAPVEQRPVQRQVQVVGTFHGQEEIVVSPKIGGRVTTIHHDVGDVVDPGEPLLEIDPTDYQLAVDEAEGALQSELAKLGLEELPAGEFDVDSLPNVRRTLLLAEEADRSLQRAESLRARKVNTPEDLDQAQTDYDVAEQTYRQTVMETKATLAVARHKAALLATARQRLADTRLVVPTPSVTGGGASYVVSERMVSEGEMLQTAPPEETFRLVIDDPLKLKATVPERYVGDVRMDQDVEIAVEAYPDELFAGRIARLNPTVDRVNRTFQIEIQVPNAKRRLRAGNFAKANILISDDPTALTAPPESVVSFAGVTKVFVVRGSQVAAVPVRTGVRGEGWLEVIGDLQAGDHVVTSGHSQLADGSLVQVRGVATGANVARKP